jgi:hypothetical protein
MTWTCDQIESGLSDYLDGLLGTSERAAFEAHAESCPECAPLLTSVRELVLELHGMGQLPEPPRLVYSILDKTLGPRDTVSGWQGFLQTIRGLTSPKFAYGAASVFATLLIVVGSSGFNLRKPKIADLHPANVYRNADRKVHLAYAQSVKYVSDLRVVYEIQSSFRQTQDNLQTPPSESLPKEVPEKAPGHTDDQKPAQPRQQNRADGVVKQLEMLAAEYPVLPVRSIR